MGRLRRVDAELVRRSLARSRTHARELIEAGRVRVDGEIVHKVARQIDPAQALLVEEDTAEDYVSRGAYKLLGALDYLGDSAPQIQGKYCLDAGASTGGFTDVLVRRGAEHVFAVDVGYGQIAWKLRNDPRVSVIERTNVRTLDPNLIDPPAQLVVGDLSFISLTLVIPALVAASAPDADFLLMVKPQFEIGRERLGAGGVVRNLDHHHEAVCTVARAAREAGLTIKAVAPSPLPGPAGNVEYFLYMSRSGSDDLDLEKAVAQAIADGPAAEHRKEQEEK